MVHTREIFMHKLLFCHVIADSGDCLAASALIIM